MKVAFTVWDEKISPVFDSTDTLLIVEINNNKIKKKTYTDFNPKSDNDLTEKLLDIGIDVFVCGAITQIHYSLIEACKIKLIPFIGGDAKEVIQTFVAGDSLAPTFLMPGCTTPFSVIKSN